MIEKTQIVQKAEELFLRYGIKSVSMDDIARELGISKKTLYQSVDNKTELIEEIFSCRVEEEKEAMLQIHQSSTDAVEEILKIANFILHKLRQLSPAMMYDLQKYYHSVWKQMEALHHRYVYQLIRSNLELGIRQGVFRQTINPDIIAKLFVGKISLAADNDLFPIGEYRLEDLFRQHIIYHLFGVASPRGLALLEKYQQERPGIWQTGVKNESID